jgi:hypothetical protein
MPLLDHFHPPLFGARRWESIYAFWATAVAARLNLNVLPPGHFAEVEAHVGCRIEVDVRTFDRDYLSREEAESETSSSVITLWALHSSRTASSLRRGLSPSPTHLTVPPDE